RRSHDPGRQRPSTCDFMASATFAVGSVLHRRIPKKARELKERQTEIALRIEQHQKGEGDFRTRLESLISLASRAAVRWRGCGRWLMQLGGPRARPDGPGGRQDTRGNPRRSPQNLPIVPPNGPARRQFWAT